MVKGVINTKCFQDHDLHFYDFKEHEEIVY